MGTEEFALQERVEVLYSDHHGWLRSWLRGKLGSGWDAADLAHDTFLRLMTSHRLPADLGREPRALLTHIAKGLVVDHWRRQEVERAYLEALAKLPEPELPTQEARLMILDALQRVDAMLSSLPERTREVFVLSQLEEFTYQEVADRLGTSLITVKRHMRTAFAACLAIR